TTAPCDRWGGTRSQFPSSRKPDGSAPPLSRACRGSIFQRNGPGATGYPHRRRCPLLESGTASTQVSALGGIVRNPIQNGTPERYRSPACSGSIGFRVGLGWAPD